MVLTDEQKAEFERLAEPLVNFLAETCPDTIRIVIYSDCAMLEQQVEDDDSTPLH